MYEYTIPKEKCPPLRIENGKIELSDTNSDYFQTDLFQMDIKYAMWKPMEHSQHDQFFYLG